VISKVTPVKKVCILTDHHISINPRVWKEAFYFESRGWTVVILCKWQSAEMLKKDRQILEGHNISYRAYLDMIPRIARPSKRMYLRVRRRIAGEFQRMFGTGGGWSISHAPGFMYRSAIEENADLYRAHLECAFFVGRDLVQAGKKVSFDFEDWYSHDYLVPERPVKLLETLEKFALANGSFCTAASQSMAIALQQHFREAAPEVIYNGFPEQSADFFEPSKLNNSGSPLRILWFSRTVAQDRGLEYFLEALKSYDHPVELNLLGNIGHGYDKYLEKEFPFSRHALRLHAFISHDQLHTFISQFNAGLSIEEHVNENRYVTVTNKILQYLQAGIPVLASDTMGNREVAALFPSVVIANIYEPAEIINALETLRHFSVDRDAQQKQFEATFSWEAQEKKLDHLMAGLGYGRAVTA